MNTLVELLNAWGGRFIDAAWPMLWQSGVLIAVVFALDLALRKRVRATTRYALWLLVLAKLVVPTSLSLPTGIAYWLPAPKPVVAPSVWLDNNRRTAPTLQPETDLGAAQTLHSDVASSLWLDKNRRTAPTLQPQPALSAAQTQQPDPATSTKSTTSTKPTAASSLPLDPNRRTAPTLHWRGVAALSWLAGMAALSGVLAFRARLTRRMIAAAIGTEQFSSLLAQCASRLGMQGRVSACSVGALRRFPSRVTLKLSATAATPAVCGLFHPVILLPMALAARLSAAQLEAVLLHELAHVRRGDPWVNYAQALLQIFYFYNPLLWLANAAIRRAREEAVDELVLVSLADEAPLYPETLLQVAKFSMQIQRPGFGWVGILERKSTVGGRIRLMLHRPWPKSARLGIRGGLAVLALAAVLLPMKSRPQQPNPAKPVSVPSASPEVDALCAAIYDRHWPEAMKMIDSGAPVNGVDDKGRTPLGCLVEQWNNWTPQDDVPGEEVLQELLKLGADPFAASAATGNPDDIRPPVESAMDYPDAILGSIMLTNKPSPVRRTPSGLNALQLAFQRDFRAFKIELTPHQRALYDLGQSQTRTNLIDFLLSHGFSADQTNAEALTWLQEEAWNPVNGPFVPSGNPPPFFVHTASSRTRVERGPIIADLLLSRGATLDVFSASGLGLTNPLAGILRANPKLANARDAFGRTPLHYAARRQSETTALLLTRIFHSLVLKGVFWDRKLEIVQRNGLVSSGKGGRLHAEDSMAVRWWIF